MKHLYLKSLVPKYCIHGVFTSMSVRRVRSKIYLCSKKYSKEVFGLDELPKPVRGEK
jgi:hypothetical protein